MEFDELVFKPHSSLGGVQARVDFPNGYGVSVVGGGMGLYGNGSTSFELAILHGKSLCYSTPITDDVMGWLTREEVTATLQAIERLDRNDTCHHHRPDDE